jgi:hypothetical protein
MGEAVTKTSATNEASDKSSSHKSEHSAVDFKMQSPSTLDAKPKNSTEEIGNIMIREQRQD